MKYLLMQLMGAEPENGSTERLHDLSKSHSHQAMELEFEVGSLVPTPSDRYTPTAAVSLPASSPLPHTPTPFSEISHAGCDKHKKEHDLCCPHSIPPSWDSCSRRGQVPA